MSENEHRHIINFDLCREVCDSGKECAASRILCTSCIRNRNINMLYKDNFTAKDEINTHEVFKKK